LAGTYQQHLKLVHNTTIKEHLINEPNDTLYFKKYNNNITKFLDNDFVTCKICGEKYKSINEKHCNTHEINLQEYKYLYDTDITSQSTNLLLKNNYNLYLKNSPFKKHSKAETEIKLFLELNNLHVEQGNRSILDGIEIDLLCEEKILGSNIMDCIIIQRLQVKKIGIII
jgi:hypothetical protein